MFASFLYVYHGGRYTLRYLILYHYVGKKVTLSGGEKGIVDGT